MEKPDLTRGKDESVNVEWSRVGEGSVGFG